MLLAIQSNTVKVRPHARKTFCCRFRLHFKAAPTPLYSLYSSCRVHPTWGHWLPPECGRSSRASGLSFLSLSPHTDELTPGSRQIHLPFSSSVSSGLPHQRKRSTCSPFLNGFIPQPDSLSDSCPALSHEAASFALCFGLWVWLAPQAEYNTCPWFP